MSRSRTNTPQKPIRTPQTSPEWARLMMAVIDRAEQIKAPNLPGLRQAQASGKAEAFLRRLGIIHTGDIDRELPLP